ncbi:MAG: exodeoxyribonuclease V subunit gamma [Eubacteriales bacterium]|nr:exodeoxyribonuclease V subunit gamma [Eubacteriales bacterium]
MMLFELITGAAGSGKSACIEEKIEECIACGKKAMVIVPERFSHIEERTLCARFDGLGLNGIEVTTFSKLSRRLSSGAEYLHPSGREMMILKAAKENADAGDGVFGDSYERSGFVEQLSQTITELKRSLVTPEMLSSFITDGLLGRKLSALSSIYQTYNDMFKDGVKDPDENMSELAELIESDGGFTDTRIFIDGFSDFMPAHYLVIEALIKRADTVTVALTITDEGLRDDEGIYAPVKYCVRCLDNIAKDCNADFKHNHLTGEYSYVKSDDVKYFLSNYEQYTLSEEVPECKNIKLYISSNRHNEVENLAGRIIHEIRENGLRFRDIGVIVGNPDTYLHIIDAVFSEYNIAYYADNKMSALEHPVVRMVLSVFKIITENWSFQSVFEYLRSGFVYRKDDGVIKQIDQRSIDRLEIYCKTRGIRGKNVWLSEQDWKAAKKGLFDAATDTREQDVNIKELDSLRRELMEPFSALMNKIAGRRRVKELACALFEFLEDIHLYEGLLLEQEEFEKDNMLDEASRIGEVWDAILETLNQAVLTSGDEYISREDFSRMIEAGFMKVAVDTVPPGIDCVSVGRADMSRPVRVKALFVIGAVRGELPPEISDSGIITEADRAILSANGYDFLQSKQARMQIAEFNLFSSLTAACERIHICYPEMNDEGTETTPASLVGEIERTFNNVEKIHTGSIEWENILASGRNTYHKLISRVTSDISESEREFWDEIWKYVSDGNTETFRGVVRKASNNADLSIFDDVDEIRTNIITQLADYSNGRTHIKPEIAERLFVKNEKLSITSMEKYNQCPFSYFARYGLGLGEAGEYKVRGSDVGKMVHWAVCEYCRKVQEGAVSENDKHSCWENLSDNKSKEIILSIIAGIERKALEEKPDFCKEKLDVMCRKIEKTIERSAKIIKESLIAGGFSAVEFEKNFDCTIDFNGEKINIKGIIDRLDTADDGNGKLLRVIDYKTGAQKFSVADIYNKIDLQLIIYALAAQDMYKNENGRIAAVMYDKVRDELVKTAIGSPVAMTSAKLDGVIVSEEEKPTDEEIAIHDATLTQKDAKSAFLPLQTKKAGGLKSNNSVISRAKFNMLSRYVTKTAIETKNNIRSGYIAAKPLGEGEYSPCAWCEYSAICLHNKDRDGIRTKITANAKAWEKIEMEDSHE